MVNKSKDISWTSIIIVALILIFIGAIYFGGNLDNENYNYDKNYYYDNNYIDNENNDNSILNEETISISGIDKIQEISNNAPIKLVISGIRNTITVKKNTQVNQIIVSGIDIIIYLPEGNSPKITDSGIRTKISYY